MNRDEAMRNAEMIAHARASELNAAMFKRNEVRKVEADARERKLREKELMIAHQQQRSEERQREEANRADGYDKLLSDLEKEEYDLLVAIEGHRVRCAHASERGPRPPLLRHPSQPTRSHNPAPACSQRERQDVYDSLEQNLGRGGTKGKLGRSKSSIASSSRGL